MDTLKDSALTVQTSGVAKQTQQQFCRSIMLAPILSQ